MGVMRAASVMLFLLLIISPQFIQAFSFGQQAHAMRGLLAKKAESFKSFEKGSGVDQFKWIFDEILSGDLRAVVKINRTNSAESISDILAKVQHKTIVVFISSVEKKVNLESSFRLQPGKHAGPMASVHQHLNKISQHYLKARGNVPFPAITIGVHDSDKAFIVYDQATHTFLLNTALVGDLSREEGKHMEILFSKWFDLFSSSLTSYNKATHGPLAPFLMEEAERVLPALVSSGNGTSVWFCLACVVALAYAFPIAWNYGAFYVFKEVCEAVGGGDDGTCGMEAIDFLLVTGFGFLPVFAYEIFKICGFKNPQNCRNNHQNQILVK